MWLQKERMVNARPSTIEKPPVLPPIQQFPFREARLLRMERDPTLRVSNAFEGVKRPPYRLSDLGESVRTLEHQTRDAAKRQE